MAELGPGQERAVQRPAAKRGWGSRFSRILHAGKLGEPPFLTRANGGHHAWNSARVFNPVGQHPRWPQQLLLPARSMRRLRARASRPQGRHWWGKKRASRADFEAAPCDKKEGYPAVRPDTLRERWIAVAPAQNGGRSSPLATRLPACLPPCVAALVRACIGSALAPASRTM